MGTWMSLAWLPICTGLTAAGLVFSFFVWRKRGVTAGARAVAWSLLPLAVYLVGAILLIGRIGSAIVQFSSGFAFSPKTWFGVIMLCAAGLLFLGTGGLPLLRWRKSRRQKKAAADPEPDRKPAVTASSAKSGVDEDLADVRDILRKHGIS